MNTFTKLPEFPFFVVHRAERWCVYTVTQNVQCEYKVSLRWFENSKYLVADYYTKIDILGYLKSGMWLLCNKDGNIIENKTEEKEVTTLFNEQFYTDDFDREILDFIVSKGWVVKSEYSNTPNLSDNYLVYGNGVDRFWTSHFNDKFLKLTKEEFKEKIGMTNVVDVKEQLDKLLETDRDVVLAYIKELATREDNIRKELEFAEAKKTRLEKHIDTLKSKLQ